MANKANSDLRIATPLQAGEVLRRRRKARALSQRTLAEKLGISQGRLSNLETDASSLTLARLIQLANLLGLEVVLRDRPEKTNDAEW